MTLREELYAIASRVKEEKEIKEREQHIKDVQEHLNFICRKSASRGDFEVFIPSVKLKDGLYLTCEDIEYFAKDSHLDYTKNNVPGTAPIIAILSFKTANKR